MMETVDEQLKRYIIRYQNYDGARIIACNNSVSDVSVLELVGGFYLNKYKMDSHKLFYAKIRRGYWMDNPSEIHKINWFTRIIKWFKEVSK